MNPHDGEPQGPPSAEAAGGGERFEALYERLQAVTARLEGGELTLDESLALYEEGMELARRCQHLLAEAEQRIEVLRQAFDSGFGAPGR